MAAAHPTPLSTAMAAVGQLSWQAPHSIQASGRASWATRSFIANTPCGQTAAHISQPMQRSGSYRSVFTGEALITTTPIQTSAKTMLDTMPTPPSPAMMGM